MTLHAGDATMGGTASHIPVLCQAVVQWLAVRPGGAFIDATVGLGGHAQAILEASTPGGRLLGVDRDPAALAYARQRLLPFAERALCVQASFAELGMVAHAHGFAQVDGILLDLGVSSLQLDDATRGFSFRENGPLDMRMDPRQQLSADEIVNTWPESELSRVIFTFGEERYARRIARAIVKQRPLRDTQQLASLVAAIVGGGGRIHPATRTFQSLRIRVNSELEALEAVLPQAVGLLRPGGRLAVISFHSLEDRIVKQFMRRESQDCICPPRMPVCTCGHKATLANLTRKPVEPDEAEVAANPRSRSAKLRVAARVAEGTEGTPAG